MEINFLVCLVILFQNCFCQLVVNVKNKGGEVLRQSIESNTTLDTITLEFQQNDGTLITQFIDFQNEIQIFRSIILGEEERGQTGHQVMCFVTRFIRNEFISPDAMSKLRQKNPGAIRHPEEDKGLENIPMELMIDIDSSGVLSPYIASLCAKAKDYIYTRDSDLKLLSRTLSKDYATLLGATRRSSMYRLQGCGESAEPWRACLCHYHACVGWYPCGLKYCKGKDSTGKVVSYRCGIKTCTKCREFEYYVRHKHQCIWDEPDWSLKYMPQAQNVPESKDTQADLVNAQDSQAINGAPVVDIRGPAQIDREALESDDDDILR